VKASIVGSKLHIELDELYRELSPEVIQAFAQHTIFQDTLLEAVCDTVATGECFGGGWWSSGLENSLRERLLPLLPVAVQELCRDKIREAERSKSEARKLQSLLWELKRHWPSEAVKPEWWDRRFESGDSYPFTREDADAWLASKLGADEWARIKAEHAPAEATNA
jgi:hypothetical protein